MPKAGDSTLEEVLVRIWRVGHPASLEEIDLDLDRASLEKEIGRLHVAGKINGQLRANLVCEQCGNPYEYAHADRVLTSACGNTVDLSQQFKPDFYRYVPNFDQLGKWVTQSLAREEFRTHSRSQNSQIEHIVDLGQITRPPSLSLDLFLSTTVVDTRSLAELWVLLVRRGRLGVLLHPGMSEEATELAALTFSSMPFISIEAAELASPAVVSQVAEFPGFRTEIERMLERTRSVPEIDSLSGSSDDDPLPVGIGVLARVGGERFQAPVISLLHTLGAPENLPKTPYCPDGILLLPDGYWLVDAKSSLDGFSFSVPEREKARRYVRPFEERQGSSSDWTFFGELILTRTDVVDSATIRRARDFLLAEDLRSSIVLLSFEGLSWLWKKAWAEPKYWRCCNIASDTRTLLELRPNLLNSISGDPLAHEFAGTRVRLVSEEAIKSFWSLVLKRRVYHELRDRTPEDIMTMVRRTLMDLFARRSTQRPGTTSNGDGSASELAG